MYCGNDGSGATAGDCHLVGSSPRRPIAPVDPATRKGTAPSEGLASGGLQRASWRLYLSWAGRPSIPKAYRPPWHLQKSPGVTNRLVRGAKVRTEMCGSVANITDANSLPDLTSPAARAASMQYGRRAPRIVPISDAALGSSALTRSDVRFTA